MFDIFSDALWAEIAGVWLDVMLKGAVLLTIAAVVSIAMRRAAASVRHMVWLLAVVGLLLLPVLSVTLPGWGVLPRWADVSGEMQASPVGEASFESVAELVAVSESAGIDVAADVSYFDGGERAYASGEVGGEGLLGGIGSGAADEGVDEGMIHPVWLGMLVVWGLGALGVMGVVCLGMVSLLRLGRRAEPISGGSWGRLIDQFSAELGVKGEIVALKSDQRVMPMTWGAFRPKLLLPANADGWSGERRRLVLLHELAHIKRCDYLTQLVTRFVCALYWFNPLVWIAARCMVTERERACDDLVLNAGLAPGDYAEELLGVVAGLRGAGLSGSAAIAMARLSTLEGRLRAIMDGTRNRRRLTRTAIVTGVLAIACLALPLASMQPEAIAEEETTASVEADSESLDGDKAQVGVMLVAKRMEQSDEEDDKASNAQGKYELVRRSFVRLVVGKERMTFEGADIRWEGLAEVLAKVPNRANTVLEMAVATDEMTLKELNTGRGKASSLSRRFGFEYLSYIGQHALGSKGTGSAEAGRAGATGTMLVARQLVPENSQETGRVIHFPKDRSLGKIKIQDASIQRRIKTFFSWGNTTDWNEHAEYLCEARGDVRIPAGKRVGLVVGAEGGEDLSGLSQLRPDDLYMIQLDGHRVGDEGMAHIARLSGLKALHLHDESISSKGLEHISKLTSLEELTGPPRTDDEGLAYISRLPSLKRLKFYKNRITNEGLYSLANLSRLEELTLIGGHVSDAGLVHLEELPSLSFLMLSGDNFSDLGMVHVGKIASLRTLNVGRLPITDIGLSHLSKLSSLENLSLYGTAVTDLGLSHLASMASLKKLNIRVNLGAQNQITDDGMIHLAKLKGLEHLDLPNEGITDKGLAHIAKLDKLTYLWVGGSSASPLGDTALKHISKLRSLEELLIGGNAITDEGMSDLAKLTKLRKLTVTVDLVTDEGLSKLKALKSLENLHLTSRKITISGLSQLNSLSGMVELRADGIVQDNSGLDISGMGKLEKLTLSLSRTREGDETVYDAIRDEDLACLANLTRLKWLQGIGGFGDAGMAYLAGLTNMERLSIRSSNLTDRALANLSGMKKLNSLHISGNFTDEGLGYLENLKALTSVWVYPSKAFSRAAVQRVKDNLPNLYSFTTDRNKESDKLLYWRVRGAAKKAAAKQE